MTAAAIRSLTVRPVDLPLERPIETAAGAMHTAALVLVDLVDADGVAGRSYLRTYTPVALRALATLLDDVAPVVRGLPADPATVGDRLRAEFRILGAQGLAGAPIAGIDMALGAVAPRRAGRRSRGCSARIARASPPTRASTRCARTRRPPRPRRRSRPGSPRSRSRSAAATSPP